jgi:hypothetical protein
MGFSVVLNVCVSAVEERMKNKSERRWNGNCPEIETRKRNRSFAWWIMT